MVAPELDKRTEATSSSCFSSLSDTPWLEMMTKDLSMTDSVVSPALLSSIEDSVLVSAIGEIVEAQWVTKLEVIVSLFSLQLLETTLVSDSRSVTCGWGLIGEIV